jgi:Ca2+ regulator and membrane fusion protein Fig1
LKLTLVAVCAVDAANSTNALLPTNGTASDGTICVPTLGLNASDLNDKLFGSSGDVVPILDLALILQRKILVPLIIVATFLMLFGAILFALTKVTQMKLKNPESYQGTMKQLSIFKPATLAMIWMSVLFAFAAAVASTMGVGALNFIIPVLATNISVTGGKILQAFQYLSFILGALFAIGATLMLSDPLEQQPGMGGEEFPPEGEKNLEDGSLDESMQQEGQMEGQVEGEAQQQYAEGEYGEQQQQYAEGQEGYDEQQQQYAEGGEYAQDEYTQQQQEQYQLQQQQYQQQQQQRQ